VSPAAYRLAADAVVLLHLLFVLFVVAGGLLAWRWRWVALVHVPAAAWGAVVEFAGWICPLTPLEITLRARAGSAIYGGDFIEHYVLPVLYPVDLTRSLQAAIGTVVLLVNALVYWRLLRQGRLR
jgi:hypothetical protein